MLIYLNIISLSNYVSLMPNNFFLSAVTVDLSNIKKIQYQLQS